MKVRLSVLSLKESADHSAEPKGLGPEVRGSPPAPSSMRLQVFLAHAGVASRRAAETLIAQGRIAVNGKMVSTPGFKVLPGDEVHFDGRSVKIEGRFLYLALNKPPLYICSSRDPQGRPLALDLLPAYISVSGGGADEASKLSIRLYNVGRLDYR